MKDKECLHEFDTSFYEVKCILKLLKDLYLMTLFFNLFLITSCRVKKANFMFQQMMIYQRPK
jgi:hypothetical protein